MFNELTGANQYVGNWPGVTVERKSGRLKEHEEVELVDLPGIYSLSPYSPEEVITRKYLLEEKPDMIVDVVDATNLERNLYLTTQLLEAGLPVLVALNMIDLAEQGGGNVDAEELSRRLGCPVVKVSAPFARYAMNMAAQSYRPLKCWREMNRLSKGFPFLNFISLRKDD